MIFGLSQSTRVTDRQNYDCQDSASIAASRGNTIGCDRFMLFMLDYVWLASVDFYVLL